MRLILFLLATGILAHSAASKWPLRAPHASSVPASFDCSMRKLAYEYGKQTLPRLGSFESLYYALDLNSADCHEELSESAEPAPPKALDPIPSDAIFVSPSGSDSHSGTLQEPLKSIQNAIDLAATQDSSKTVILRGGVHYIKEAILLTAQHSSLTIRGFPGEQASVSGGVELKVDWKPYNVTQPPAGFTVLLNTNAVYNGAIDNKTFSLLGKFGSAAECQHACAATDACNIFTWHDQKQGVYAGQCWNRMDGQWSPRSESGHVSGVDKSGLHLGSNIYVANIKGQVESVPGLQLNGKRATRARYPNIPGGIENSCMYGCMIPGRSAHWTPPDFNKYGKVKFFTDEVPAHERNTTNFGFEHYMIGVDGLCSVYDPPVSYWCSEHPSGGGAFAFRTPSGVTPNEGVLPNSPYKDTDEMEFFVWRPARWANWMFQLADYDAATGNFTFGKGGNQGARGENSGGDFFVENVMEELDYPGEFFFDKKTGQLYLFYNGTGAPPADMTVVAPQKQILVNASGSLWEPVRDVTLKDVKYTATASTYMERHGVPSAGDWALDRFGAVFLQGTQGFKIDNCEFERLDGNAVMVSGYNRNATISNSDFAYIGGNAVASWGYTNETDTDPGRPGVKIENAPQAGVDGTDGEHPIYTTVTGCSAREVGLYEKQSSFFVQAKTAASVIVGNVFFNGPRAGINTNDGFGGGDEIAHNLVFSTCRESGDHGPFNSWDRQPFLTTQRDGTPSMIMQWREIHHNFFIDNYSPQEDVDNDDGSCYYHTHDNFFVYGGQGMKNDFGGHDNHHFGNVYAYVGQGLGVCSQLDGHEDYYYNNTVVMTGTNVGGFTCSGHGKTIVHDNKYFTPSGKISECKQDLPEWQKAGEDKGSTVASTPADATIMGWAKDVLHMA